MFLKEEEKEGELLPLQRLVGLGTVCNALKLLLLSVIKQINHRKLVFLIQCFGFGVTLDGKENTVNVERALT